MCFSKRLISGMAYSRYTCLTRSATKKATSNTQQQNLLLFGHDQQTEVRVHAALDTVRAQTQVDVALLARKRVRAVEQVVQASGRSE
jgi:hypothetical protein